VKVVGPGYLRRGNLEVGSADVERVVEQGKTDVYAVIDDEVVSAIALAAIVRLESPRSRRSNSLRARSARRSKGRRSSLRQPAIRPLSVTLRKPLPSSVATPERESTARARKSKSADRRATGGSIDVGI
jgi:hypothetical protein